MAALAPASARIAIAAALVGCGDLHGLEPAPPTPLATLHVRATGNIDAVRDPTKPRPRLRAAVLWGQPWLVDRSCLPPYENADHAAVAAAACGDPLGFRPGFSDFVVGGSGNGALAPDGTATLDLYALPGQLFGDTFSQLAYGSVVVYDDQSGNGAFDVFGEDLYAASFSSMTRPDTRVAFRHGGFDDRLAYYPRRGCDPPDPGYSLLSAGGFTLEQTVEAQARGELPLQDPAQCRRDPVDREVVVALQPPAELAEINCFLFGNGDQYQSPPMFPVTKGTEGLITACTSIPDHGTGRARGRYQLLVTQDAFHRCTSILHYVLRGCFSDAVCDTPDWDEPPPSWWPCPQEPR